MPTAKIKLRAFPYYVEVEDPVTGRTMIQEQIATRGQEVELSDRDFARAEKFNAIEKQADAEVAETTGGDAFSVQTASVEQLSAWLKAEKPTVEEVVDAAEDEPSVAERLIEAENHATGGQPRSTLVKELTEIVESHR